MAKRKTAQAWRAFLRALARTGNVRVAACEAGMDVGTAYDHRIKDDAFAARWEAALVRATAAQKKPLHRLRRSPSPANAGEELVVRRTKHGDQLVRAGAGRWNAKAEAAFFAELARTACVRRAAAACGFSTTALYNRRQAYPEFAERWDAVEAAARVRIPALLTAATIASLDPEIEGDDLPKVNVDQAIAIARLKCGPSTALGTGLGKSKARPEPNIEEVRDEVLRRIAAIRRHREKGEDS